MCRRVLEGTNRFSSGAWIARIFVVSHSHFRNPTGGLDSRNAADKFSTWKYHLLCHTRFQPVVSRKLHHHLLRRAAAPCLLCQSQLRPWLRQMSFQCPKGSLPGRFSYVLNCQTPSQSGFGMPRMRFLISPPAKDSDTKESLLFELFPKHIWCPYEIYR